MGLLIAFFVLSITVSFLCSVWEAVLLSITPSYAEVAYQEGTKTGKLLKKLKDDIDKPLSAILTLNTIAHTVGATGVGAQAAKLWPTNSIDFNLLGLAVHLPIAAVIVPTLMTLAILILSEIAPKSLGASNWKKLASFTAICLDFISKFLTPFIWLSQRITNIMKSKDTETIFSRKDFHTMASIGEQEGIFRPGESAIIRNLIHLNKVLAEDIMTPRTVILMADEEESVEEFYRSNKPINFSRIPVYTDSSDDIQGFVLKDRLLDAMLEGHGKKPLKHFKREIMRMEEETPIQQIFDSLMSKREHISLIVDEYGGTQGIVTMEDVLETLLGTEIMDESDDVEDLQELARQKNEEKQNNGDY